MIRTRSIEEDDIDSIVDIHIEAFPDFFLTSLGKSFLKTYYKSLVNSKDGISVCAIDAEDTNIAGFCVGTTKSRGFHKRLIMNNFIRFGVQFLKLSVENPKSLSRLLYNLEKQPIKQISGNVSELLSIGVRKSSKGTGVGSALIQSFESELLARKSSVVTLTTDFYSNEGVMNFYRSNGYEIHSDFISYPNRRMYKMIKYL